MDPATLLRHGDVDLPDASWQLAPAELAGPEAEPLSPRQQAQWIWAILAVAVAARTVRYLLCFPLWEDECFLSANYFDGGYLDMLRPLNYRTVCPVLFSWVQLTVIRLLGFNEYSLRLFSFACGLGSLFLFRHLAGLLLRGSTLVLAVAVFAASYPVMRYAAEAKPYGCDLLVSLVLMTLAVHWWRQPQQQRWLWAMTACVPLAVGLSYPAVFVGGGLGLVLLWRLVTVSRRAWVPWAVYYLALLSAFAVLFAISIQPKLDAQLATMSSYWEDAFPPLGQPWKLPLWLISVHSGSMLAYPVGGPAYGSTLSLLLCAMAGVVLWRRRALLLLGMTAAPLVLNFIAAAMRRYPYGEHMRMTIYMAPMFCILVAVGVAAVLAWRAHWSRTYARAVVAVLGLLWLLTASSIVRDFWSPYKSANDLRARSFAQWFWFNLSHEGELVCLHTDLKTDPDSEVFQRGCSAVYLCNQRIYSPRHARQQEPQWERISESWPLRVVQFRSPSIENDQQATAHWLRGMEAQYRLVGKESYPFPFYNKRETQLRFTDYVDVYKFVPKAE